MQDRIFTEESEYFLLIILRSKVAGNNAPQRDQEIRLEMHEFPGLGQIWEETSNQGPSRKQIQEALPPLREVKKTCLFNKKSTHKHLKMNNIKQWNILIGDTSMINARTTKKYGLRIEIGQLDFSRWMSLDKSDTEEVLKYGSLCKKQLQKNCTDTVLHTHMQVLPKRKVHSKADYCWFYILSACQDITWAY